MRFANAGESKVGDTFVCLALERNDHSTIGAAGYHPMFVGQSRQLLRNADTLPKGILHRLRQTKTVSNIRVDRFDGSKCDHTEQRERDTMVSTARVVGYVCGACLV